MSYAIKTAAIGLALAAVAPAAPADASPLPSWYGRYVWEEGIGRIGGSTRADSVAAFITYTLSLGPGEGATGCRLDGEGYQTNEHILCTATPQGNAVIVKFYRYAPEKRFGTYRIGTPLFTMTRTPRGIVTQLQALSASSDVTPSVGKLFRRTR